MLFLKNDFNHKSSNSINTYILELITHFITYFLSRLVAVWNCAQLLILLLRWCKFDPIAVTSNIVCGNA